MSIAAMVVVLATVAQGAAAASSPSPSPTPTPSCAWGKIEVGLLDVEKGTSICELLDDGGIGKMVQLLVTAIIVLTIIAALVSILIGGYIYMTAGGSGDRVRVAKLWIGSAILGIILALLAWAILRAIAVNLVKLRT